MSNKAAKPESRPRSPCIRQCTLNPEDICVGCYRHVDEIVAWGAADEQRQREILQLAKHRRQKAKEQ